MANRVLHARENVLQIISRVRLKRNRYAVAVNWSHTSTLIKPKGVQRRANARIARTANHVITPVLLAAVVGRMSSAVTTNAAPKPIVAGIQLRHVIHVRRMIGEDAVRTVNSNRYVAASE